MIDQIIARLGTYQPLQLELSGRPRAAVLIPLYNCHGELHVVLTKRTDKVAHHKGEISFPGGAMDPADSDLLFTALRECHEEIGVLPVHVRLIGQIDDINTVSKFHVSAFVGALAPELSPYAWVPQSSEVAEVLEVPLTHLIDRRNVIEVPRMRDGEIVISEAFQFGEHTIWGATARMLRNFLNVAIEETAVPVRPKR